MKKLMPLILIIVSIGVFFFFIDPKYKEIQQAQSQIEENDQMLELAKELQKERDTLQAKFNSIGEADKDKLEKVLPDTIDNVRLILDINNIADYFGIAIAGITVAGAPSEEETGNSTIAKSSNGKQYGTISVGFSVSATYEVFKAFLTQLEESLRLVDVRGFSVNAGEGVFYNYSVNLDTYWLR